MPARVISGKAKGRRLKLVPGDTTRPIMDRVKESLFNILVHAYDDPADGGRVIDLFAGTGALGLEAVSRGAKFALLVDDGSEARALIRGNVEALGLGGSTRIFRRDARKLGDGVQCRLAQNFSAFVAGVLGAVVDFCVAR